MGLARQLADRFFTAFKAQLTRRTELVNIERAKLGMAPMTSAEPMRAAMEAAE